MNGTIQRIAADARHIGIGEYGVGGPDVSMRANLGSCVALCLVQPAEKRIALAHILLARAPKDMMEAGEYTARYATSAVPLLLRELGFDECRARGVVGYVAGGSAQYGAADGESVGFRNREALLEALRGTGIRIKGRDLGGANPRQLVVDGRSGRVLTIDLKEGSVLKEWALPPEWSDSRAGSRLAA